MKRIGRLTALCLILSQSLAFAVHAQGVPGAGGPAGPTRSGFITLEKSDTPVQVTLAGQAAAVESASVRPLVDGIITAILYEPGREVEANAALFTVDPQTYEASLAAAEASLKSAEAAVPAATAMVARYEKLIGTGATQEQLDTARTTLAQAEAAVAQAEANLQIARINMDRTTVRSPVAGVTDVAGVSLGDLVTSGQSTALTTVTSLDPINVDLSEASARMLDLRSRIETGTVKPGDQLAVSLSLENGQSFDGTGTLASVGSVVSTTTGTVRVRFRFDNPHRLIKPGMFVRARLTLGTAQGYLVPQLAASVGADGQISVWLLDQDNKSVQRKLTPMGSTDSAWIVAEGLEDGDRLLVDNIANMTAGTEVSPVAVTISDQGLIQDTAAAGSN